MSLLFVAITVTVACAIVLMRLAPELGARCALAIGAGFGCPAVLLAIVQSRVGSQSR